MLYSNMSDASVHFVLEHMTNQLLMNKESTIAEGY